MVKLNSNRVIKYNTKAIRNTPTKPQFPNKEQKEKMSKN